MVINNNTYVNTKFFKYSYFFNWFIIFLNNTFFKSHRCILAFYVRHITETQFCNWLSYQSYKLQGLRKVLKSGGSNPKSGGAKTRFRPKFVYYWLILIHFWQKWGGNWPPCPPASEGPEPHWKKWPKFKICLTFFWNCLVNHNKSSFNRGNQFWDFFLISERVSV